MTHIIHFANVGINSLKVFFSLNRSDCSQLTEQLIGSQKDTLGTCITGLERSILMIIYYSSDIGRFQGYVYLAMDLGCVLCRMF